MELTDRKDILFYAKLAERRVGYVAGQLELTSKCEQFCPNCDSWKKHKSGVIAGELPFGLVQQIFEQLNTMPTFEHLALTGGDPVSHPDFEKIINIGRNFKLQVNTALPLPIESPDLWRRRIDSLRVSLDATSKEGYYKMRGVHTDPEEILARLDQLAHPFWATNTCVADANVSSLFDIVARLSRMDHPPRRANFLAVLDRTTKPEFWRDYDSACALLRSFKDQEYMGRPLVPTSVAENVHELREFLLRPEAEEIPCHTGSITFHIKCNGDLYPCCLTGGEAIVTRPEYKIGNVYSEDLDVIRRRYLPQQDYKKGTCKAICQWKQFQLNKAAHEASKTYLRMP